MYSAYKLNKQSDKYIALMYSFPNLELVCCSMSGSNCCFLTCIQVSQEAGLVFPSHEEFSIVVIHTVKGFSIFNEEEVDVFLEIPCSLYNPTGDGNLVSGSSIQLIHLKFLVSCTVEA